MEYVDPSVNVRVAAAIVELAADAVKLPSLAHCQSDRAKRLEVLRKDT
jgi:hypothetical protein